MKRIVLFLATNLAILLVLSVSMRLLGVEPWLNGQGLNLTALLIFAAVMGFGGSLISLAVSKWMAKKMMGVRVIKAPSNTTEAWLVDTVRKYAGQTGIGMPEVGIYDAPDVNAFARGRPHLAVSRAVRPQAPGRVARQGSRQDLQQGGKRGHWHGVLLRHHLRPGAARQTLLRRRPRDEYAAAARQLPEPARPGKTNADAISASDPATGCNARYGASDVHGSWAVIGRCGFLPAVRACFGQTF